MQTPRTPTPAPFHGASPIASVFSIRRSQNDVSADHDRFRPHPRAPEIRRSLRMHLHSLQEAGQSRGRDAWQRYGAPCSGRNALRQHRRSTTIWRNREETPRDPHPHRRIARTDRAHAAHRYQSGTVAGRDCGGEEQETQRTQTQAAQKAPAAPAGAIDTWHAHCSPNGDTDVQPVPSRSMSPEGHPASRRGRAFPIRQPLR